MAFNIVCFAAGPRAGDLYASCWDGIGLRIDDRMFACLGFLVRCILMGYCAIVCFAAGPRAGDLYACRWDGIGVRIDDRMCACLGFLLRCILMDDCVMGREP